MAMALRALKFYGTDPQLAPSAAATPQGLRAVFSRRERQSEGAAASGARGLHTPPFQGLASCQQLHI